MKSVLLVALLGMFVGAAPVMAKSSHDELPPGLQKKVAKGEPLPPGWQKKAHKHYRKGEHLDRDYHDHGRVYDIGGGRQRVEVEDRVYTIIKDTREILDILDQH